MEIGEPRHPESVQSYHDEIDDHILAILFVVIIFRVATLVSKKKSRFLCNLSFSLISHFLCRMLCGNKRKEPEKADDTNRWP
jgi:hypothetical protein